MEFVPKTKAKAKFVMEQRTEQWLGGTWNKVEHVFEDYPNDVRYILFHHSGTDNQFWAGNYGAKFTGASVTLEFAQ